MSTSDLWPCCYRCSLNSVFKAGVHNFGETSKRKLDFESIQPAPPFKTHERVHERSAAQRIIVIANRIQLPHVAFTFSVTINRRSLSVCPSIISPTCHLIDFTLGGCIAEDPSKCSVECLLWIDFDAVTYCWPDSNSWLQQHYRQYPAKLTTSTSLAMLHIFLLPSVTHISDS